MSVFKSQAINNFSCEHLFQP